MTDVSDVFERLVGVQTSRFESELRSRTCFVSKTMDPDLPRTMSWDRVNHLLNTPDKHCDDISIVKGDDRLDRRLFVQSDRISPAAVRRALRDGYSLLFNQVQNHNLPVRRLSEALTTALGEFVGVNIYVSWLEQRCFNTHWDEHDVFIFQCEGEKEWSIFKPTRAHPNPYDIDYEEIEDVDLKPAWRGVLSAGDVLYIPCGWWHHAVSTGAGSVHMTAGFRNQTGLDLLDFLSHRAVREEDFRAPAPRLGAATYEADAARFKKRLIDYISREVDDGLLDRFWADRYGALPARRVHTLPTLLDFNEFHRTSVKVGFSGLAPRVAIAERDSAFTIETGGRALTLDTRAKPVVQQLLANAALTLDDLMNAPGNDLSADDTRALVFELLNDGALYIVEKSETAAAARAEA